MEKNTTKINPAEFISERLKQEEFTMNNMEVCKITVPYEAVQMILKISDLSEEAQKEAIDDLVDRTEIWLSLDTDVQIKRINQAIEQKTVLTYLEYKELLKNQDMTDIEVMVNGDIVVTGYNVHIPKKYRKMIDEYEKEHGSAAPFDQGNIIDLARERLKRKK